MIGKDKQGKAEIVTVAIVVLTVSFSPSRIVGQAVHPPTVMRPLLTGDVAYIVNGKSDSVSVIDMNTNDAWIYDVTTGEVITRIPIGKEPHQVVIKTN